jgi:hypothetical protein
MFDFLKKSKPLPQPKPRPAIRIIERELGSLTLDEWRQDGALCIQAASVLQAPIVRQMLQVLHNSHPAFQVMLRGDANERAMQQARCEGYTMCLADIESMGQGQPQNQPVEADFVSEEITEADIAPFKASGKLTA